MTHRERIIAALQHKEPDRIPVDLGANESTGIMAVAYNRLQKHLGIAGRTQIYDPLCMVCKVELSVLDAIGADVTGLYIEPARWKPWKLPDGSNAEIPAGFNTRTLDNGDMVQMDENGNVLSRSPAGGLYFDPVGHPLENARTLDEIDAGQPFFENFDWADYFDEGFKAMADRARKLHSETDYAVFGNMYLHVFAAGQALRGFENFMMDLMVDKPLAHRLLGRLLDTYLPRVDEYLEAVGKYVDIVGVNDDLGTQKGAQISPELYREMIKPYQKRLWQYIKEKSGKPLMLHSCGSIYEIIPDLIEMGVDALNPIQVSAANMDTKKLKAEFRNDLTFWGGGCDTQMVLARGTPDDVRQEVRRRVDDLAPGGGFVFCQVHNIQADVPVENILAMYEELGTLR
ncbi:MAG: methyltransferase [Actinobacteria bacterium]|nr:methyltransferase [Actinomycetota bacterium]